MDVAEPAEEVTSQWSGAAAIKGPDAPAYPTANTSARSTRHALRTAALVALVFCLMAAGAGSVLATSRANRPDATASLLSPGIARVQLATTPSPPSVPSHIVTIVSNPGTSHAQTRLLAPQPPSGAGQAIVVSLSKEQLWAYQNGQVVYTTLVTTGMPALPTPLGTFSIYNKVYDTEFISPWPPGSPFYYSPEHVNYAMEWLTGGYFIHDAPWRGTFGPGTEANGSHGCIEVPTPAGAWLYNWVGYGATVQIVS